MKGEQQKWPILWQWFSRHFSCLSVSICFFYVKVSCFAFAIYLRCCLPVMFQKVMKMQHLLVPVHLEVAVLRQTARWRFMFHLNVMLNLSNVFLIYRLVKGNDVYLMETKCWSPLVFFGLLDSATGGFFFLLFQKIGSVGQWEMKKNILGWP